MAPWGVINLGHKGSQKFRHHWANSGTSIVASFVLLYVKYLVGTTLLWSVMTYVGGREVLSVDSITVDMEISSKHQKRPLLAGGSIRG